jgi:soluble lytic murein transglycosylase-like protein
MVSRVHARLVFENARWWIIDNDSTNGTYLDGELIQREPIIGECNVQLGEEGPVLHLDLSRSFVQESSANRKSPSKGNRNLSDCSSSANKTNRKRDRFNGSSVDDVAPFSHVPNPSVSRYIEHYFRDQERPAGEHTRMLRQAYQHVQKKQKRSYRWVIGGVLALCVVIGGWAAWLTWKQYRLEATAEQVFFSLRSQSAEIAQLRQRMQATGGDDVQQQLALLKKQQARQRKRYGEFVRELGVYRDLSAREAEIYRTARIFGESEFGIPAGFVRKVKATIQTHWQREPYRSDLANAIRRADKNGYTPHIVRTMQKHGLPPEFFYLALQESRFKVHAVGPKTRWGIAKGMWQFIPETARKYGLRVGPREGERQVDLQDERFDFELSTQAAARYLQDIYSTDARASGLLVMASYNWGERRVVNKLNRLPTKGIPEAALKGIPEDADQRNYWRFLTEFSERMPEETKQYVLKIFAAAVIGQNPGLFGFSFDNPLTPYTEAPLPSHMLSGMEHPIDPPSHTFAVSPFTHRTGR